MSEICVLRPTYRDGSECGEVAGYRVYGANCYRCCDISGQESCIGHAVCAEHAIRLRTDSVAQVPARSRKDVPAFTVERIYSLSGVS